MEDGYPVGKLLGLIEVLRGEQDGRAAVRELPDRLPHLEASLRIEAGGRLVEEHHRRAPDQAHRDVEPPAHATRVGRDAPSASFDEREADEQLVSDPSGLAEAAQPGDQLQVLAAGQDVVDRRELAGEADRLADLRGLCDDVEPVHGSRAAVGPEQRREDLHDRRLARAVRTEEGEDAARLDFEVDASQDRDIAECLREFGDPDRRCRAHDTSLRG